MTPECIAKQFQGLNAELGRADHLRRRRVAVTGGGEPLWVHSGLAACFGDRSSRVQCGGAGGAADLWTGPGL